MLTKLMKVVLQVFICVLMGKRVIIINSPYLVNYYEIFIFNNDLYVVMQYFKDGNLNDFIKRYREANQRIEEGVYFYFI
jgi:serine/threonine protein kinase